MLALLAALTVLCIGDSITNAAVEPQNYCDNSAHDTFNAGVSFTRALDWAAVSQADYDVLGVFEVGHIFLSTNDAVFGRSAVEVKADLLTVAWKVNAPIVVISLEPFALGAPGVVRNPLLAEYHIAIRELWAEHDWIFPGVDWPALPLVDTPEFFIEGEDGLHPNAFGHAIGQAPFDQSIIVAVPEPGTVISMLFGIAVIVALRYKRGG